MAKQAYVYSGTDWVPLASEVTNLSDYQTKALAQAPYRNLVINGAMQVAQRGTSVASITSSGYRTVDRFNFVPNSMGTWTMSQEADAPTGSGFRNSTKLLCTTADASPAAGDYTLFIQSFEGQNLQSIRKGTASAQQLTLSFWVKSNVTGTYVVELYDNDNSGRQISKSYSVSTSGTWEFKTITFPADTTGAFDNDNNNSLAMQFWLGAGSTFTSGTLNSSSWAAEVAANRAAGVTNLASATNNYWQITGVQLEVGAVATPFEFKSFDKDLDECERYFQKSYAYSAVPGTGTHYNASVTGRATTTSILHAFGGRFPKRMRTAPTMKIYHQDGTLNAVYQINDGSKDTITGVSYAEDTGYWYIGASGTLTAGEHYYWQHTADAEL